jgi:hypothetical protein
MKSEGLAAAYCLEWVEPLMHDSSGLQACGLAGAQTWIRCLGSKSYDFPDFSIKPPSSRFWRVDRKIWLPRVKSCTDGSQTLEKMSRLQAARLLAVLPRVLRKLSLFCQTLTMRLFEKQLPPDETA